MEMASTSEEIRAIWCDLSSALSKVDEETLTWLEYQKGQCTIREISHTHNLPLATTHRKLKRAGAILAKYMNGEVQSND